MTFVTDFSSKSAEEVRGEVLEAGARATQFDPEFVG